MDVEILNNPTNWLYNNQEIFIGYLTNFIIAALTLIVGIYVAMFISKAIKKVMVKRNVDGIVASFASLLAKYLVLSFVLAAVLGRIGVQTASLVAVIGAAGLAIGLALQGSLSNFAAGVLLIILRPLKMGELVEIGGVIGTVEAVHIFTTTLISPDSRMVVIPNNNVLSGNIINYSRTGKRRLDLTIGVSYSANLKQAKEVFQKVLEGDPRVLKSPAWTIGVCALADSSVNFVVRPWVRPHDYWGCFFDFHEKIKLALDEAGVEIPFPQRDVHIISGEPVA